MWLVTGLWILRQNKYISVDFRYSGQPSTHFLQNTSAVQLALSQPICGAAVLCRPVHGPPVLLFVPSANNCWLKTSIERCCRMWLSQQSIIKKKIHGSDFGEELCAKCLAFFFLLRLKKSPHFDFGPFVNN